MRPPWLWLPPSLAHASAPLGLKLWAGCFGRGPQEWRPLQWRGLNFPNRLGLAAGVDKNASQIQDWWRAGVGFLEVGTIVPQPQEPNPGKIVDRDIKSRSVWNKMGFPSQGADKALGRLEKIPSVRSAPVFLNLGKNRQTPNESAHKDYVLLIEKFAAFGDGFVINISSPNTKGLRELLTAEYLNLFLAPVLKSRDSFCPEKPLLLKLSPDLNDRELEFTLLESLNLGVDGWVLTNTTTQRPEGLSYPVEGGVSGAPLAALSREVLKKSVKILGEKKKGKLIISAGGICSVNDIEERLDLGADLLEIYSALIFEGPNYFQSTISKLKKIK